MNTITTHYLNLFLGLGAILLQILTIVTLLLFFSRGTALVSLKNIFLGFIKKHFLTIGFLISLMASAFSLIYSEIIQFPPCELCWYQRIFLFPQVFLFGFALWNKDKSVVKYSLSLLSVGFLISIYHNIVYYFGNSSNLPCDLSGISCYKHLVTEFNGYISIPMLALTVFLALITTGLVSHFYIKKNI